MPRKRKSLQVRGVHKRYEQTGFNECRVESIVGTPNKGTSGDNQWMLILGGAFRRGGWSVSQSWNLNGFPGDSRFDIVRYGRLANNIVPNYHSGRRRRQSKWILTEVESQKTCRDQEPTEVVVLTF